MGPRPGLTEATLSYTNATPYLAYGGANQDGTITLTVYAYSTPDGSVSPGEWDAEGAVLVGTTSVQASSSPTNEDLVFDLDEGPLEPLLDDPPYIGFGVRVIGDYLGPTRANLRTSSWTPTTAMGGTSS
ncbi:hypothetical protein AAII07_52785 [Microvirga sp. 0TCS3.31]